MREKSEDDRVDVLYFASPLIADEFLKIITVDMSLAVGSMLFVFFYMRFQTGSWFIAVAGMTEILLR